MKKLLLTLTLLLTLGFAASAESDPITVSFANTETWTGIKTSSNTETVTATNNGLSFEISNGYWIQSNALFLTKSKGYIVLPAFDAPVTKIEIVGYSGCATAATVTVSGDDLASTTTAKIKGTTVTVNVNSTTSGVQYKIAANSSANAQIETIKIYLEGTAKCNEPKFNVEDGAELFAGQTISVNKGNADTCELFVNNEPVDGLEYTIPATAEIGSTITLTANSTLEGGDPAEASASINVTVVEVPLVAEFVFSTFGWSNQTEISTVNMGVVTLNFDKKSNSNTPKYFTNNKDVRLYGGGALTISVDEAYYITKIESVYKNTDNLLTADCGSFNSDYTLWTNVADDAECYESTVTFTESGTSGNRSWTSIVVSYAERPTPVFAGLTHEESFGKTVVRVEYMLHLNNHNDSNPYTVELTVGGKTFINKEHTDATIVEETANAPMRVLNPDDVASETTLKGTILATGLEGSTPYGAATLVAKLGSKVLGTATIDEFTTGTTGIEDVTVENEAAAEYFNLQGVRVAEPQAGQIYIVRRGGKATKELVK